MENIWPTIVVGSMGDVGSWDCSSVTSNWINVFSALLEADVAEVVEVLDPAELAELAGTEACIALCNP
jgi:hypothetical protein